MLTGPSLCIVVALKLFWVVVIPTGTLAATYEKLGGEVKWMGKPGEVILLTWKVLMSVSDA